MYLATRTEVMRSGTEVPAARKVIPMVAWGSLVQSGSLVSVRYRVVVWYQSGTVW